MQFKQNHAIILMAMACLTMFVLQPVDAVVAGRREERVKGFVKMFVPLVWKPWRGIGPAVWCPFEGWIPQVTW